MVVRKKTVCGFGQNSPPDIITDIFADFHSFLVFFQVYGPFCKGLPLLYNFKRFCTKQALFFCVLCRFCRVQSFYELVGAGGAAHAAAYVLQPGEYFVYRTAFYQARHGLQVSVAASFELYAAHDVHEDVGAARPVGFVVVFHSSAAGGGIIPLPPASCWYIRSARLRLPPGAPPSCRLSRAARGSRLSGRWGCG